MGILDLFGAGDAAAKPIDAIGNVLDKLTTTDAERLSAQAMMEKLRQNPQIATIELNKLNAQDSRLFNSGWRPAIGWICAVCVGLYYIPQFILAAYLWFEICTEKNQLLPYPMDASSLMQLVYLMLGFGLYRSVEKLTGVSRK